MTEYQTKELQVRNKQEVASPSKPTKPGPVFTPAVDIFETDREITLLADLPGVKAADLTIDLQDDTLTITGDTTPLSEAEEQAVCQMVHESCRERGWRRACEVLKAYLEAPLCSFTFSRKMSRNFS